MALAARFKLPHINLGDVLAAEISARTPLGLRAKEYTDATKTVPDE
jgi:adenylate kinase